MIFAEGKCNFDPSPVGRIDPPPENTKFENGPEDHFDPCQPEKSRALQIYAM